MEGKLGFVPRAIGMGVEVMVKQQKGKLTITPKKCEND